QLADAVDEEFLGTDDEDLVPPFFFELAQRHPMFLEELDEVLAGNAAVLTAGNPVAAEPPGIEPLADGTGRHLTDFRDLAGGEHFFHGRHSNSRMFAEPSPGPVIAGTRPESRSPPFPSSLRARAVL